MKHRLSIGEPEFAHEIHGRTRKLNPSSSLYFFVSFRLFHGQSPFVGINSQKATPNAFASKQDDGLRTTRWDFLLTRHKEKSAIAKTRSLPQARDWRVFFLTKNVRGTLVFRPSRH